MVKKGRKRSNEPELWSGDSSDGGESPLPKKAAKLSPSIGASKEILICEISSTRRVVLRKWKGVTMVDIREFYEKGGEQLAGRKGISLPKDQWKILCDHIDEINQAFSENP
ncbi:RNA polymerase II transcriptional coactivator KIWI-like isoform X1 [Typha angustifolia]|uniref:RNA polymerase II transcriptional coactivator KIWI-like isoform X1 n=1 Tax=Typha angustifolia TaxID=59011 RepID=UPI003C2F432E